MDPDGEDELPPLLVTSLEAPPSLQGSEPPTKDVKVPITIVTGRLCSFRGLADVDRIPWGRQNHVDELHPGRTAWQENCGDTKWLVYTLSVLQLSTSANALVEFGDCTCAGLQR